MKTCTYIVVRTNKEQGPKIYFGIKQMHRLTDEYRGSGKKIRKAVQEIGIEHFKRTIVKIYDTHLDALRAEHAYLTKVNAASNPNYYNRSNGGNKFRRCNITYGEEYRKTHAKVFLKREERTDAQKRGDATRYQIRSAKRLQADREHSKFIHDLYQREPIRIDNIRTRMLTSNPMRCEQSREKLSNTKSGKNKHNDNGRKITSDKLKGNRNCETGWVKLARMTDSEFQSYALSKSQHPSIQGQIKTKRAKGIALLTSRSNT